MRHIWMSDCESLVSHLKNPRNERLDNVKLSIDIQGLKTMLWEKPDRTPLDDLMPEATCENAVRWIDTSCMVVDCLTKRMDPSVLIRLMRTGTISLQATVESELSKLRKQKNRKAKKLAEKTEIESKGYLSLSRWLQKRYDCGDNVTWSSQRKLCYQSIQLERSLTAYAGASTRTTRRSPRSSRTSRTEKATSVSLSSSTSQSTSSASQTCPSLLFKDEGPRPYCSD